MTDILDKLEAFRAAVAAAQLQTLLDQGYDPKIHGHAVKLEIGKKYARIDTGGPSWSGKYMVDMATGEIFGIKGYGVIHRGHRFGTLDTIDAWDWRGYRAMPRKMEAAQ